MQQCEDCERYTTNAFRRAETGKVQCDRCYLKTLRSACQTGLVRRPRHLERT